MCTADAGVLFATQVGSNILQTREQVRVAKANYGHLTEAMTSDVNAIALRSRQQLEATQQRVGERALDAQREVSRINAVVADSGMSGGSVDRLRKEVMFNAGKDISTLQKNAGNALKQAKSDINATALKYQNATAGIKKPSVLGSTLSLFGDYLDDRDGMTFGDLFGDMKMPAGARHEPLDYERNA